MAMDEGVNLRSLKSIGQYYPTRRGRDLQLPWSAQVSIEAIEEYCVLSKDKQKILSLIFKD